MIIALWSYVTGGFFTFGFSVNSGRVLMLVLHIFSSLFLYLIARSLTQSRWPAVLAVLFFSISPLAIYFQRRVLLDNIMVFFLLFSLLFLIVYNGRLRNYILSAILFGCALLVKLTAIFFLPIFLLIAYFKAYRSHRSFALMKWTLIVLVILSIYPLFAALRGELFPAGPFSSTAEAGGVNLYSAISFHASRTGGLPWEPDSDFRGQMSVWLNDDPILISLGIFAMLANLFLGFRDHRAPFVAALAIIPFFLLFMRGGMIIDFYILALIPFFALNIAYLAWVLHQWFAQSKIRIFSPLPYMLLVFALFPMLFIYSDSIRGETNLYTADQTSVQIEAVEYILTHASPSDVYVIDNYGYIDFIRYGDRSPLVEYYWKLEADPYVQTSVVQDNPDNIDYIVLTPQMQHDLENHPFEIINIARENVEEITRFEADGYEIVIYRTI